MTPKRFATSLTEWALAAERPLDQELEWAAQRVPSLAPRLREPIHKLRGGDLAAGLSALEPLGLDPLVARAILACPSSASAAGARLRRIPSRPLLALDLQKVLAYLALVLAPQAVIGWVLATKVLPSLLHMGKGLPVAFPVGTYELAFRAAAFAGLLAAAAVALLAPPGILLLLRGPFRRLERARQLAVAGALAGKVPPPQLAAFTAAAGEPGAPIDPASGDWDSLAAFHVHAAVASARRRRALVASLGGVVALGVALAILASVYLSIPLLSTLALRT